MADSLYYLVLIPDDKPPSAEVFANLEELKVRLMAVLPEAEKNSNMKFCVFYGQRLEVQHASSMTTCTLETPGEGDPVELTFGSVSGLGLRHQTFIVPEVQKSEPEDSPQGS